MDDFGEVCYLDVHKTGSSYVSRFLEQNLRRPRLRHVKHAPVREGYDPQVFYFISARHPLDQYLSLYFYGCQKRGALYIALNRQSKTRFYDGSNSGFDAWLRFVLDPENAPLLGGYYSKCAPALYGLQTFRFLVLSLQYPVRSLRTVTTKDELRQVYAQQNIANHVIRTENLNGDLIDMTTNQLAPFIKDADLALLYLQGKKRLNKSSRLDVARGGFDISPALIDLLKQREWFLFETLQCKNDGLEHT